MFPRLSSRYHAGEVPDDPTIGFLPPNNGTTGQGFVTFRINAAAHVTTNARIDANASIVFDQNEPIITPPIFNTVRLHVNYYSRIMQISDVHNTNVLCIVSE